jgi:hypothetical protein
VSLLVPLALAAVGMALVAFARSSEKRRRTVLTATLVAIVFVNCLWGAFAIRRTNISDRELDDMRAGLSRLTHVDRLTFVALTPPSFTALGDSSFGKTTHYHPPAQLIYALASLWPQASMNFALSWESAMPRASPDEAPAEPGAAVFIAWSRRGRFRGTAPDMILKTAAAPFRFHGLEVIAYVRNRDSPPRVEEDSVTTRLEQRQ